MLSLLSRGTRPAFAASFGAASPSEVLPTAFQKGGGGLLTAPKSTLTIHALIFHFFFLFQDMGLKTFLDVLAKMSAKLGPEGGPGLGECSWFSPNCFQSCLSVLLARSECCCSDFLQFCGGNHWAGEAARPWASLLLFYLMVLGGSGQPCAPSRSRRWETP